MKLALILLILLGFNPKSVQILSGTIADKKTNRKADYAKHENWDEPKSISEMTPEILETSYCNIQRDNQVILEKQRISVKNYQPSMKPI